MRLRAWLVRYFLQIFFIRLCFCKIKIKIMFKLFVLRPINTKTALIVL